MRRELYSSVSMVMTWRF